MKVGDEIIIQSDQNRPDLIKTWGFQSLVGQGGKITHANGTAGSIGYGSGYGILASENIWTVQMQNKTTYNVPEALITLKENQNGGNTMLVSVRVLSKKKDEDEQILIPATEFVAKDANTALLRVGAENSDAIKKAIADGLAVRPVVQTIA